ncbi:helicase C-terminal domain-containing protein, partial [bacterium]|nr:helicase C-terminal domain-containing protein [bacterium]
DGLQGTPCLIAGSDYNSLQTIRVNPQTAQIVEFTDNTLELYQARADSNTLSCPCCGKTEQRRFNTFRPARLGAPFLLNNVVPTLLESAPIGKGIESEGPFNGKRLITFTDSRQGTARFAAKMQQNAERNYIRSSLYHHVSSEADSSINLEGIEEKQKQIDTLTPLVKTSPDLQPILEDLIRQKKAYSQLKLGRLSWQNAKERLADDSKIWKFIKEHWADYSSDLNDSSEIARLFLYREFARRPKWQNNAETLGLLSLRYPKIDTLKEPDLPAAFRQCNRSLQDWKDFLKVCLDYYVRDNSFINITYDFKRWIGAKVPIKYLLAPDTSTIPQRHQKIWPHVNPVGRQPRLVLLLSIGLGLDFKFREHRDLINECLSIAWNQLFSVFEHGPDGERLNLEKTEIEQTTKTWLCPITRKLLDTTFCGLTPYIPRNYEQVDLSCKTVELPSLPFVFGNDGSGNPVNEETITEWLNSEPLIQNGRMEGYWSDINDKMILQSPYFRVAEHSAQLPAHLLLKYEAMFKSGKLNILSCSTTMELGVDIGGVSIVAMNNAPPNPANYLQRSGRAGRRQEQTAVSFTLCKNNPHGELVFKNPKWPFLTPINIPYVSLNSSPIIERHVNALLLSLFLAQMVESSSLNMIKLSSGSFFIPEEGQSNALCDRFIVWLEKEQKNSNSLTQSKIKRL